MDRLNQKLSDSAFGLISAPLTTTAVSMLRPEEIGNATAIFNLLRNLGGSVGISAVTTLLARREQLRQTILASRMTPYDWPFRHRLLEAQRLLGGKRAYGLIYGALMKQSSLLAFIGCFRIFALLCLVCAPLAMLFKNTEWRGGATAQ